MRGLRAPAPAAILASVLGLAPAAAQRPPGDAGTPLERFVRRWCAQCHAGEEPEADLDLVQLARHPDPEAAARWIDVGEALRAGEMPPEGEPRPSAAERETALRLIDERVELAAARARDPGRTPIRRLTRFEYIHTVEDILGVHVDPARFPPDPATAGFDRVGAGLSFSPLHFEIYARAARDVAGRAIRVEPLRPPVRHIEAEDMVCSLPERVLRARMVVLYTSGSVFADLDLPRRGRYRVRACVAADQAGREPARAVLTADGAALWERAVPFGRRKPLVLAADVDLPRGRHRIGVRFPNDFYAPENPDPGRRDRNLLADWIEVAGPLDPLPLGPRQDTILAPDPGRGATRERARPVIVRLATRLFRRPPTEAQTTRFCEFVARSVAEGDSFEAGVRLALEAMLLSPSFLLHVELPAGPPHQGVEDLDDWSLAARLSYYLWSSAPDEELSTLAARGELRRPGVLLAQARRLLADAKAYRLASDFAVQWWEVRRLERAAPDPDRFPGFDAALRAAMRKEAERLFFTVLREGRPASELIDARYTFLNERLARHYGVPDVRGERLRKVELRDPRRGGVLGLGAVLTVTSNPTRTSPVKRGKWILDNLLGDPPPPPPPEVPRLVETPHLTAPSSLREALQRHARNATCASCHARMDPLGFSLENFDAVGRWRDHDENGPIDASGVLPDGKRIEGPAALRRTLRSDPAFVRCLLQKLFVYAIGREVGPGDALAIERLARRLGADPTLADAILGIVELDAFRRRRAEE